MSDTPDREKIKGWTLVLHTRRTSEIAGKKWTLKDTEGMSPVDYQTTDSPAEIKVFNSWDEADDFRSRIYVAEPGVYPEGWGWEIKPVYYIEAVAIKNTETGETLTEGWDKKAEFIEGVVLNKTHLWADAYFAELYIQKTIKVPCNKDLKLEVIDVRI